MKENNTLKYVVIFITILLLGIILFLLPTSKKSAKKEAEITVSSISEDVTTTEPVVSAKPQDVDVTISEEIIAETTTLEEPDYYKDLWLVDEEGRKYIWVGQEIEYKDDYDEAGIILTEEELLAGQECSNIYGLSDEYLETLYPITLHIADADRFIEDVPVWLSNELIVFAHEKVIPFLVEEGYDGDVYLLYDYTSEKYNGGTIDVRFYIANEDAFNAWNNVEKKDYSLTNYKKMFWIHKHKEELTYYVIDPWYTDENGVARKDESKLPSNW